MHQFRDEAAILITLFMADGPVSGAVLCHKGDVSLKTLKKTIERINHNAEEQGFTIEPRLGQGYEIEVSNKDRYRTFRDDLMARFQRNLLFRNGRSDRAHLVIRHVLSVDSVTLEDLAASCYCSVSTISRCMDAVRARLARNHLSLEHKAGKGLCVIGSEWDIRMALVHECSVFREFELKQDRSNDVFRRTFLMDGDLRSILAMLISRALREHGYEISYGALLQLCDLYVITLVRQKHVKELSSLVPWFSQISCEGEKALISDVVQQLPGSSSRLTDVERLSLAVFLKANRIVRHASFQRIPEHAEISHTVDLFIEYLNQHISVRDLDVSGLRRNLECNFAGLLLRAEYGIHTSNYLFSNFTHDGLVILDLCALLYQFLKEHGVVVSKFDALSFYPVFASLSETVRRTQECRVLVVSRYGYYYSKSVAEKVAEVVGAGMKCQPAEYVSLTPADLRDCDCIATDIDELRSQMPDKTVMMSFFREGGHAHQIVDAIWRRCHRDDWHLVDDDVVPAGPVRDEEDILRFIQEKLLAQDPDAGRFISAIRERDALFAPERDNQVMVLTTLGPVLEQSIVKFLVPESPFRSREKTISLVVVYALEGNRFSDISVVSRSIANLLHTDRLEMTGDRSHDVALLRSIMEELSWDS